MMLSPPPVTSIAVLNATDCTQSGWLPDLAIRIVFESMAPKTNPDWTTAITAATPRMGRA